MLAARRSGSAVVGAHRRNVAELKSTRKQRRRARGRYRGSGGATGQVAMQTDGKRQGLKRGGGQAWYNSRRGQDNRVRAQASVQGCMAGMAALAFLPA